MEDKLTKQTTKKGRGRRKYNDIVGDKYVIW